MNTTWLISESVVVGAMCPLEMDAEFSVGRAVHAHVTDPSAGLLIQRSTSPDGTSITGDLLTSEEWTDLQSAEEALSIKPTRIDRPVVVWVLRSTQRDHWWSDRLEQLKQLGALAHQESPTKPRSTRICLVRPTAAGTARDTWSLSSHEDAWRSLLAGERREALRLARRAFCLAPRLYPRDAAMLVVAYSQAGKSEDAEGVLAMVKRSKNESFVGELLARRERLLEDLQASQARPTRSPTRTARSRSAFDAEQTAGLRAWSLNHEAPAT
jgi:hypothetical protein